MAQIPTKNEQGFVKIAFNHSPQTEMDDSSCGSNTQNMDYIQKTDFYNEHSSEDTTSGLLLTVCHISTQREVAHTVL